MIVLSKLDNMIFCLNLLSVGFLDDLDSVMYLYNTLFNYFGFFDLFQFHSRKQLSLFRRSPNVYMRTASIILATSTRHLTSIYIGIMYNHHHIYIRWYYNIKRLRFPKFTFNNIYNGVHVKKVRKQSSVIPMCSSFHAIQLHTCKHIIQRWEMMTLLVVDGCDE